MCWIFGYNGKNDAVKILLHGLERLEYRGYDSAWIFVRNQEWSQRSRAVGKVSVLTGESQTIVGKWYTQWIAHTRWATHGGVTEANTHPHVSNDGKRTIVHNGIVENYASIKKELIKIWYTFSSETDTEVVANLLQDLHTGSMIETVQKVQETIRWAYALLIMHSDTPDTMIALRLGSPLVYAYNNDGEQFFSSDTQALSGYADKMIYLEDGDLIQVQTDDYTIFSNGDVTKRDIETFDQESLEASKGEFKHFMLKEIYEQPAIIKRIYKGRVSFENNTLHGDAFHGMGNESIKQITTVACGTANNAGRLGTYRFETLSKIPSINEIASEYENKPFFIDDNKLHVFVSQSGETADSLEVLKMLKEQGWKSFGVVNVVGSSIARLTDSGLYLRAGTEIWVASTKAFMAQSMCLLLLSLFLGKRRGMLISDQMPTIFNLPHDEMFEQNLSNFQEIKAREGKICVIWDKRVEEADRQITIPETIDEIYPFLTAVAGQLLAYHVADLLGNDIDKPRNLAKSVTVK